MTRISGANAGQFAAVDAPRAATIERVKTGPLCCLAVAALCAAALPAHALPATDDLAQEVQRFASQAARAPAGGARVAIEVGTLDPRLKLAPCERVEPYLPAGTRLWGKAHIGVRCADGPVRWNVYLPITVHVWGRALVAAAPLAAGTSLKAADLVEAEVDVAAGRGRAFGAAQSQALAGRVLVRPLAAGAPLRAGDLKARQWFAAGDSVRIRAQGSGFVVAGSGEALTPGIEGRSVRVRTEGGRVVVGEPVGEREVELAL